MFVSKAIKMKEMFLKTGPSLVLGAWVSKLNSTSSLGCEWGDGNTSCIYFEIGWG